MSARRFWSWGPLFAGLAAGGNSIENAPPLPKDPHAMPSHLCRIRPDDVEVLRSSRPGRPQLSIQTAPGRGVPFVIVDAPGSVPPQVRSIPGRGLWYSLHESFEPVLPEPRARRRRRPIDAKVREADWARILDALRNDSELPRWDSTLQNSDPERVRG